MSFFQRLEEASERNASLLCVGLDPEPRQLPDWCLDFADPVLAYNRHIIDLTCDLVCAYKANAAFYEALAAAERMLAKTADLYEQRYMRGLAQIGLAITAKDADRSLHITQALETYQGALKNCSTGGILEKMTDLLEELAPLDSEGILAPVRGLLVWA